ncbi:MAG: hypothetical protein KDD21_03355 [Bacteroidetes bacterium]|nr:hypothetical protein [Bacteroidota bacterium]
MKNKYALLTMLSLAFIFIASCSKENDKKTESETCVAVQPSGNLSYNSSTNTYTFDADDGMNIILNNFDSITITKDDIPKLNIKFWEQIYDSISNKKSLCANHENLNGKHIKDRLSTVRSILLPDDTKLTFYSAVDSFYYSPLIALSIYHNNECHRFNLNCNKLVYSMDTSSAITRSLDSLEVDGETAALEFYGDSILFVNIYNEYSLNNKIYNRVLLASTNKMNINNVRDYYDDTRLVHTFTKPILNPKKDE